MPLHLDYRPDRWDDFEGNTAVVASLQAKLRVENKPHTYLFTGPSGCGKTTLARLLAITLGALSPEEDPEKAMNYRELDAASYGGIDSIREIRKTMRLSAVAGGTCRVFLLDECHQLSPQAQEALLKALEDTPAHVFFILATTEPQKLKATLKRRCADYKLQPLSEQQMRDFLYSVADCEEKEVPEEMMRPLIEKAEGSPGRALMALEKVIDLEPDQVQEILSTMGEVEQQVIDLCRALIGKKNWAKTICPILQGLKEKSDGAESVRLKVFGYATSILSKEDNARAYLIMEAFREPIFDGTGFGKIVLYSYESLYAE